MKKIALVVLGVIIMGKTVANIENHHTEPEVRSVIRFTGLEVRQALIDYAKKKGYIFRCGAEKHFVWYPNRDGDPRSDNRLVLGIDAKGCIPAITYSEPNFNPVHGGKE